MLPKLATSLLAFALLWSSAFAQPTVASMIGDVRAALITAAKTIRDNGSLPPFRTAELELVGEIDATQSAGLKLLIIKAGGEKTTSAKTTIKVRYRQPAGNESRTVSGFADALADAVVEAATSVAEAREAAGSLLLTSVEVSIRFLIKEKVSGEIGIEFEGIGFSGGGNAVSTDANSITLHFEE